MREPYNLPQRESSDQGGSTRHSIAYVQEGIGVSTVHTAFTFIPCDIANPVNVEITPVLEGRSTDDIVNGVALFTTVVGWYVSALLNESLSAIADVDDWVYNANQYFKGQLVLNPDDDEVYICIVDHTASTTNSEVGFQADVTLGYWQLLSSATFNKAQKENEAAAQVGVDMSKMSGKLHGMVSHFTLTDSDWSTNPRDSIRVDKENV